MSIITMFIRDGGRLSDFK